MKDFFFKFPEALQFDLGSSIDESVRSFSRDNRAVLSAIKDGAIAAIGGINTLLEYIPWWLLILIVMVLGWRITGKKRTGLAFGAMMFFIGSCGL